jgi:hypothetical protein
MRAALAVALAAAGCAEPVVEISLKLPASQAIPPTFDLKCVTAIDIVAHPDDDVQDTDIGHLFDGGGRPPCVELERTPENFTDIRNALRGRVDIPIPLEGLLGIQIRGRIGSCSDRPPYHEAIFYGAGRHRDDESISVPLVANISCNTRRDYEVRPVDLLALTTTKACPTTPLTVGEVFAGNVRPTLLDPERPRLMFEGGTGGGLLTTDTAMVSSYTTLGTGSCVTVAYGGPPGVGVTCVNPGAPTVCGEVNELEVPALQPDVIDASTDDALYAEFGPPTFIGVWETTPTKAPLAGATVTFADPDHGQVQFLDLAATRFTSRAGPTGPSGLLAVYSDRVQEITITAPGHSPRTLFVGGIPNHVDDLRSTALVVLNRN